MQRINKHPRGSTLDTHSMQGGQRIPKEGDKEMSSPGRLGVGIGRGYQTQAGAGEERKPIQHTVSVAWGVLRVSFSSHGLSST